MKSKHNFKKQFGQNFLRSDRFAHKLVESAEISENDHVVEIGPGDGRVTNILLKTAAKVIAIEIDYDLIVTQIRRFNELENFEIVHQDIMAVDFEQLHQEYGLAPDFKVVGSLPYNISKQIISKMFDLNQIPKEMAFILQEEVADVYAAKPPKATFLSNWLGLRADVKKTIAISKKQFYPEPKVNGGIIRIIPNNTFNLTSEELSEVSQLVRIGFSAPRKTLLNNLKASDQFTPELISEMDATVGLDKKRPAEIELEQWIEIYKLTKAP